MDKKNRACVIKVLIILAGGGDGVGGSETELIRKLYLMYPMSAGGTLQQEGWDECQGEGCP